MRKISKSCSALMLSLKKCITMDDGALNLLMMLDDEFQRLDKTLLITEYDHLDLLVHIAEKEPLFLKFRSMSDAVLHMENSILETNGDHPLEGPIQLMGQQLLSGLSHKEIFTLSSHLTHRSYNLGDSIIKKGSSPEEVYFPESGQLAI